MNKNSWSLKRYIVKDKDNKSHKINCYGHTLKGANNIDSYLNAYFKNLGKSKLLNTPIIPDDLKGIKVIQQQAQKKQQDFMKTIKNTTQRAREENIKMGAPSNPTPFTRIPPPTAAASPSAFRQANKTPATQPTLADATKMATAAITAQANKAQKLVTQTVSNTVGAAKEAINTARENLAAAISPAAKDTPMSLSFSGGRRTRRRKKRKRRRTKHKRKKKKSTRRKRKTRRRK